MKNATLRELHHRCHDYPHLISRWKRIARAARLEIVAFAHAGDYPIYCLRSRERPTRADGLYVSAGIHGDEPAAPEALTLWAESHLSTLASMPLMILPCLNPWGLVNNQRIDARGRDLNRLFDRDNVTPIREWKRLLAGWRFGFVLNLHEDYDAQGIYGYELHGRPPDWGPSLLRTCSKIIPIDPRPQH